jgi:tripartite-type tricarboxylate transporter receptor subunit TctC
MQLSHTKENHAMKMIIHILFSIIVLIAVIAASDVSAQNYPLKPIRLIVPFPPGGGADAIARIIGKNLAETLGQPIVIDNRAGAGGIIGLDIAAKAAPDGYTLLMAPSGPMVIHPSLHEKLSYDPSKDFAPISQIASTPLILVVRPSFPVKSVKELIQIAKASPGTLHFASVGKGGSSHLAAVMFMMMTVTNMVHVPYRGFSPALTALLSGEVQLMFASPAILPQVRSDKLLPLAVTSAKRSLALPEVSTIAESGVPGYETASWYGMLAPTRTPRTIIDRLNREIVKIMEVPDLRARLASEGADPVGNSPDEFTEYIKLEIARWSRIVKQARIQIN